MSTVVIGDPIVTTLAHYLDGDVGTLEYRLVNLDTGTPTAWGSSGITQLTASGDGPPWTYEATRDSTSLPAGTYQAQWQRPSAGPWVDDDEILLVADVPPGPPSSDLDKFRLFLGDIDPEAPLFTDDEVNVFLEQRPGSVLLAVADACDALARRFARESDVAEDGQEFSLSQISKAYAAQAQALRDRSAELSASAPWFGGSSHDRKEALAENPDRVQPAFRRDQFNVRRF